MRLARRPRPRPQRLSTPPDLPTPPIRRPHPICPPSLPTHPLALPLASPTRPACPTHTHTPPAPLTEHPLRHWKESLRTTSPTAAHPWRHSARAFRVALAGRPRRTGQYRKEASFLMHENVEMWTAPDFVEYETPMEVTAYAARMEE